MSKEYSTLFYDEKAIELVERIDYDFSTSDLPFQDIWFTISRKFNLHPCGPPVLRAKNFDDKIRAYITDHPRTSVVSLAAGLDTTFYRVDNGLIHWYDLDLSRHFLKHATIQIGLRIGLIFQSSFYRGTS